jgi:GGDEF domain-containing protein
MQDAMAAISVDGANRFVSCSFGVAQFDGRGFAETVEHCDELMYRAKRAGGGRVAVDDNRMEGETGQA